MVTGSMLADGNIRVDTSLTVQDSIYTNAEISIPLGFTVPGEISASTCQGDTAADCSQVSLGPSLGPPPMDVPDVSLDVDYYARFHDPLPDVCGLYGCVVAEPDLEVQFADYTITTGDYFLTGLELLESGKITIDGNVTLHIGGGSRVWFAGEIEVLPGGSFDVITDRGVRIAFDNTAPIEMNLYAPNAEINLSNMGDYVGSLVGNDIYVGGPLTFYGTGSTRIGTGSCPIPDLPPLPDLGS